MSDDAARLIDALTRLPAFQGVTWRAAAFELTAPLLIEVPLPTTRDPRVATENFRAGGAHLLLVTSARDIGAFSAHPSDREVVVLPGTRLVPASAFHDVNGLPVQVVVEQSSGDAPLPAVPDDIEIAAWIEDARAQSVAAVSTPGRFGALPF